MPKLPRYRARIRGDPWTIRMEVFSSTCLRLHVHSHTSYFFLLLQRSQKVSVCAQKTLPHPSSALCSHPPAWREVHHLFQGKPLLEVQQSRSCRAVFLTSELCLFFLTIFFPPQQPRKFCQNVFSTCSLLVMLSVLQICYQCH